jgi:hypothetical protein
VIGDRPAHQPTRPQVHHGGQVEKPATTHGQISDVADVAGVRRSAVKSRWSRSGTGAASGSGIVVRTFLRSRSPTMPCSRITRSTRLWLTFIPAARNAAVTRGEP